MNEQTDLDQLCECFLQAVHRFAHLEKEMHTYGTGQKLHLSETHIIVDVGNHDNINITGLAKLQGVSRSAVSRYRFGAIFSITYSLPLESKYFVISCALYCIFRAIVI